MTARTKPKALHLAAILSALALTGGVLAACGSSEPAPTPTPTAVFASEDEAFAAAEKVYRAYTDAFNDVSFQDPKTFEPLAEYTGGRYAAKEREGLSEMHAERRVRGGETRIEWFHLERYDPGRSLIAKTCNDVSATTFSDAEGNSLLPEGRPSHYALSLTFELEDGAWVLTASETTTDPTCPPA